MSYFYDAFDDYIIKNKTIKDDGQGGYVTTWENGATVKMALDLGSATEVRQAQAQKLQTVYTAVFPKDTPVGYDTYLEHAESGAIFRITSNPKDNQTPKDARYQSCYATAIRTELPRT